MLSKKHFIKSKNPNTLEVYSILISKKVVFKSVDTIDIIYGITHKVKLYPNIFEILR